MMENFLEGVFIIDHNTIKTEKIIADCKDYVIIKTTYRNEPNKKIAIEINYKDKFKPKS